MALIPQSQSVVAVFVTPLNQPSNEALRRAVGADIRQEQTAEGGRAWVFTDETVILVRQQAPGLYRIEVREQFPAAIDHRKARSVVTALAPKRGAKPHSVGINYDALLVDPPENLVRKFIRDDELAQTVGIRNFKLGALSIVGPAAGAEWKLEFQHGATGMQGDGLPVISVKSNYSYRATTLTALRNALTDTTLAKADTHLRRALQRLGATDN